DARRLAGKAIRYLRAAGRDAAAKNANREAADYLNAALALAERAPEPGAEPSADEGEGAIRSLDIVQDLARVRQRLGDYKGALELLERLRAAAEEASVSGKVASVRRAMGLACFW